MARRKRGQPVHGWLNIDKPAGLSSSAVVNKVKWVLDAQKAGHAGTLDPDATGLLAVALGEATKTIPYLTNALKAYAFTMRFGTATNTDDASGQIIARSDTRPTADQIRSMLDQFVGYIRQVPPQFSAVKVEGVRAYDLARNGQEMDLAARELYVDRLTLIDMPDASHAHLELICGSGGYVRSIARDLGVALGGYAHVRSLRRIWSGPFALDDAVPWDQVNLDHKTPELAQKLQPVVSALGDLPQLDCPSDLVASLKNGNPVRVDATELSNGDCAWISANNSPLALGTYRNGSFHPSRVFVGLA